MADTSRQDELFQQAAADYGAAVARLARAYEADPDLSRDLVQDIHVALWRSFEKFKADCSLRTWVFRVAHNTAVSHVIRERRRRGQTMVSLEEIETLPLTASRGDRQQLLDQLLAMIRRLKPIDRQVILAYLEDMDAAAIGAITGLSPGNVATKVHRIKKILAQQIRAGEVRR